MNGMAAFLCRWVLSAHDDAVPSVAEVVDFQAAAPRHGVGAGSVDKDAVRFAGLCGQA